MNPMNPHPNQMQQQPQPNQLQNNIPIIINNPSNPTNKPPGSVIGIKRAAPERATRLPLSRVKTMMKYDPDVNIITNEAAFLVAKATEHFIEVFAKHSYQ